MTTLSTRNAICLWCWSDVVPGHETDHTANGHPILSYGDARSLTLTGVREAMNTYRGAWNDAVAVLLCSGTSCAAERLALSMLGINPECILSQAERDTLATLARGATPQVDVADWIACGMPEITPATCPDCHVPLSAPETGHAASCGINAASTPAETSVASTGRTLAAHRATFPDCGSCRDDRGAPA